MGGSLLSRSQQAGLYRAVFAFVCLVAIVSASQVRAGEFGWQERSQVLFDPDTQTAERVLVRVVDLFPDNTLSFAWEPARGSGFGIDPETGIAEGEGRLVWRISGLPTYDDRSIFAVFEGGLVNGRPDGQGRLTLRSGEIYDGAWVDGLREGVGYLRDAEGNHYQGDFVAGYPDGEGVQTAWDGTRYDGSFRHGLRDGTGKVRLPGGTEYSSIWDMGREVQSDRPSVVADSQTGGLLRAQSGDDASRVVFGLTIDARMTAQEPVQYSVQPGEGAVLVYPAQQDLVDMWNARTLIQAHGWDERFNFEPQVEAMLYLVMQSQDGRTVDIDSIWLDVTDSTVDRKPMLSLKNLIGCIGYRPHFVLYNHGWGAVNRAVLRFRFVTPGWYETVAAIPTNGTASYEAQIAGFADAAAVELETALRHTGADIATLRNLRFQCSRSSDPPFCLNEIKQHVNFGALTPFLGLAQEAVGEVIVGIDGELEFFWTDESGQELSATQRLYAQISLTGIENIGGAEEGDIWTEYADAPSHLLVDLPVNTNNYRYPIAYRGQRTLAQLYVPIKLRAPATSIHNFRAAVQFRDGSIRYSQPVQFYYLHPRVALDESAVRYLQPAVCTQSY